jgi:asparagine synthase (glutamine-hydrolysing)
MPGIVGLITKMPRAQAEPQLRRMVEAIRHESFYETGTWIDESLGIYVGWVARKGSFCDGMPLTNERGDVVMVFSGEDFPEPGTALRLKERGHTLDAEGPSYLVHLYEEDQNFPLALNGMFQGLVIDRTRGTATLFNDRYGMHRLYTHESSDGVWFGSEGKAILAAKPELSVPDPQGLAEFVTLGCVVDDRTIFKNLKLFPSGSRWVFENGALRTRGVYFDPREWEEQEPLEKSVFHRELQEVFSRNLGRYFRGQERVAMTLTGGMDTRMVMAWHKAAPGSLPCYTFGGMFRDCQDVLIARRVAQVCGQNHQTISVGNEFLSQFDRYAQRSVYFTEGGVDLYHTPDLYISEQARKIAPAKVVGTYGSEILRQSVMFKPVAPMAGLYQSEFLSHIEQAKTTYAGIRRQHPITFAAFRQSPWYHWGVLTQEQSQLTVRSPYLDNDFVRTVYRAPKPVGEDEDVRLRLIREGNPALAQIPTDRGIGMDSNPLFSSLARAYQEFTFKAEYAYDYGMPQWVAGIDHALSALHLERLFLGRHKLFHFRLWYRDALSSYVRQILLDPRTLSRPYIGRQAMETMVEGHLKGNRNYTLEIHKALALELMHRSFFD